MKFTDVVFDEKLVAEAGALGHTALVCSAPGKKVPANHAVLVSEQKNVTKYQKHFLIGACKRNFFEDKRINAILGPGLELKKDHTHFRRSLTQVEATLAKKNKQIILFNFADLLASKHPEELLGRWRQDKKVLGKKNVQTLLISGAKTWQGLRSQKDLEAFWKLL